MAQSTLTPDRTPAGWGDVAQAYDTYVARFTRLYAADALNATKVQRGEQVLDIAAGSGALSLEAARRGARVVATDFAPQMLENLREHARTEGLDIDAHVMDGQALTFPDKTFDAVFSVFGLMFFPSPDKGLAHMRRVLKDDGRAGVVVWNVPERSETFSTMLDALHEAVPDLPEPTEPPAVFSLADPVELGGRMERAGFTEVKVRQVAHPWEDETPEATWTGLTTSNPVIPGLLEQVGTAKREKVREAFLRRAREKMRDGRVVMNAEAHLAIGRA